MMPTAYHIHTSRLVLRCWTPTDAPRLKAAVDESRDHLKEWMPWAEGEPEELQNYVDRLRSFRAKFDLGEDFIYGIFSRDEAKVLGSSGLHTRRGEHTREIGYWLHKDYLNQGFATEASAALTKVAFEIDHVHRVEIRCDPKNVRSAVIPRKLGYLLEATFREDTKLSDSTWRDTMVWVLLAGEYPNTPSAKAELEAFDVIGRKMI
ncbi:MAG: GNAT family N-acetyltransferase [Chloroflexi bacterium]|nr:GNAT family N-acetyltransferase [Chloroflexota bacterium]